MASLIINSKFKPFSYAEMLHPVQSATEAHQALETGYSELATKADVWENLANEQTDPYAYQMYKNYSNDLESQASALASEGLTPASRQNMLNMKNRYSSDIVPIENAYNRRRELANEQRQLLAQDNTMMFDKNANAFSLDELIENPELAYQSYSGATLTKQVGTAAANLVREMKENPRKWRTVLGGQYFETLMQRGFQSDEVLQAIQNSPEASSTLTKMVEDTIGSSNIGSWNNDAILARAYDYANQGLWNAVGDTQYQMQSNKMFDYNLSQRGKETVRDPRLFSRIVSSAKVDADKKTSKLNEEKEFIKKLMEDPSLVDDTTKTYTTGMPTMFGSDATDPQTHYNNPNVAMLEDLARRYNIDVEVIYDSLGNSSNKNLEKIIQSIDNDIASSAVRQSIYKPNITQSDLISQVIKENTRTFNRKTNSTGLTLLENGKKVKSIDIDDIDNYFTGDSDIDYDPNLGFIINSTDSKGKTRSALLDLELIDDSEGTIMSYINNINMALENGLPEAATALIDGYVDDNNNVQMGLMELFYNRMNTLVKRQSNTTSK